MDRRDLLSQAQRLLAHRVRNLEYSREQRAEPQQSRGGRHHCRRRHAVQPAIYAVQWAECGAVLQSYGADVPGRRAVLSALCQLLAEQVEQLFTSHGVFYGPTGTAHWRRDKLYLSLIHI